MLPDARMATMHPFTSRIHDVRSSSRSFLGFPLFKRQSTEANRRLIHTLFAELFQTERSAELHSQREAQRFACEPPAEALRAVSIHARSALAEIRTLAAAREMSDTRAGAWVGSFFSMVRETVADRLLDRERSYRGTLLGMRHGQDVMRLLELTAEAAGDMALVSYCERWLEVRAPLVDRVATQLSWFARNPERALE